MTTAAPPQDATPTQTIAITAGPSLQDLIEGYANAEHSTDDNMPCFTDRNGVKHFVQIQGLKHGDGHKDHIIVGRLVKVQVNTRTTYPTSYVRVTLNTNGPNQGDMVIGETEFSLDS